MHYRGIELDAFQQTAIEAIERHENVLVAAPTGAGKTVIAEYAIEKYLQEGRRIIYTAPIKALSNQKFRDFQQSWGDSIGIVTGDVSINPLAPVLIMTTEIFRNTIFDDPERVSDVEYVVLDEIHFINDIERGTVWEESLIFAPPHVGFICLSATIPNLDEFAGWLREVRPDLDTCVIREDYRPVPLSHHLWVPNLGEIDLADVRRLSDLAAKRQRRLRPPEIRRALGAGKRDPAGSGDLIEHLASLGRLPCLYFCFARAACEENASRAASSSLLTEDESREMLELFDALRQQFNLTEDRTAARMRGFLASGVAYHHAGMLPMLKEVVERIFATGLLKLLFTTETFAVGINMPACTVVFEQLVKYDGIETRYLLTREYQQMAGRAGRRGIDPVGYVYARIDAGSADYDQLARIVSGQVEPTQSQFNLSYSCILGLYDLYGEELYDVCRRSFGTYQMAEQVRLMTAELATLRERTPPEVECLHDTPREIDKYFRLREEINKARGRYDGLARQAARRHRGKANEARLAAELARLERPVTQLQERLAGSVCHRCVKRKPCSRVQHERDEFLASQTELEREISRLRHYQRDQIAKRLGLLLEFGYVDERGLTAKGKLAAGLHGFELAMTELFFAGFFEHLSEVELACLAVAVVHEAKRSDWSAKIDDRDLRNLLREAAVLVRQIERRETELRIDNGTPPLDDGMTMAVKAWLNGDRLADLELYTDRSDGDIVRVFRHAIDILRQFRRAIREHPILADRIEATCRRMKRDDVDAERQLRLGRELDRAARERAAEQAAEDASAALTTPDPTSEADQSATDLTPG